MMMALGMFVFGLSTAAYDDFQRQTEWRHASNNRLGGRPERQFLGKGDESITLSGHLAPEITGGSITLDLLRVMGDTGRAWLLIEGTGRIYGLYVIESLAETKKEFFNDGAARLIDFTINLKRVDDGRLDLLGDLVAIAGQKAVL
jgi:uncharacterized protein